MFRFEGEFKYVYRELSRRRTDDIEVVSAAMDGLALPFGTESGQVEVRRGSNVRVEWKFAPRTAGAWPVVEGVDVATPAMTSTAGIYLDYGAMEEVQVSVVGNFAEVPVRGIVLGMVAKSGNNRYRGSFASAYTSQNLISDTIDEELAAQGIPGVPILDRWDAGGDMGGKIVQDKLWFYAGARGRVNNNGVVDCVKPDGSVCDTLLTQQFYSGKLSYQMNAQHQFSGYYQGNLKDNVTGAAAYDNLHLLDGRVRKEFRFATQKIAC